MHNMIAHRSDVRTYWQKDDRCGVLKDQHVTSNYQSLLDGMLRDSWLDVYVYLFTNSRNHKQASILALLQEQMERYHYQTDDKLDRNDNRRYKITGKMGHKQDDLLIAFMMCLYWGRAIMRDPRRIK
jgi:hypothetical protein